MEPQTGEGVGSLEIQLRKEVKSPEPVRTPFDGLKRENIVMQDYGSYTFTLNKGSEEVRVYDEKGRKVERLPSMTTMVFDWPGEKNKIRNTAHSISLTQSSYPDVLDPEHFPEDKQEFIRKYIEAQKKDSIAIPRKAWTLDASDLNQVRVKKGDDFILFINSEIGIAVAFQTKNEKGVSLAPRNWIRFDNTDTFTGRMPDHIRRATGDIKGSDFWQRGEGSKIIVSYKDKLLVKEGMGENEAYVFTDKLSGVDRNICVDPRNKNVVYYCPVYKSGVMVRLDTTGDSGSWHTETIEFPKQYPNVKDLRLDPTGNHFVFQTGDKEQDLVFLDKNTLHEAKRVPNLFNAIFDEQGRIRGIDEEGHLIIYDTNLQEVSMELDKRRVAGLAQGLAADLFKKEGAGEATAKEQVDNFGHLIPIRTDLSKEFDKQLEGIRKLEDMSSVTQALEKLRLKLRSQGLQLADIDFITQGIQDQITRQEMKLTAPIVAQGLVDLNAKLTGTLTIASISEAKGDLAKLKSMDGLVDDQTRARIRDLEKQLGTQSAELFKTQGVVIEKDITEMVEGVQTELDEIISMPDFADWQEFSLPQLVSRLGSLANDCPIEASETQKKILAARRKLQDLSRQYEVKFRENYAQVREKASEVMTERVDLMKTDVDSLVDRLRDRGFKDRAQAETYVESSEALGLLRTEIAELATRDPDAAKELDRQLKVKLANAMAEIERGGTGTIAETGQQMVLFGKTLFPRWEGKVHEKLKRHVDLIFIPDERTKGQGVSADKIMGDIGVMDINSRGKLEKKRLYQGMPNEDEWRYGAAAYRGKDIFPSYISQVEYRDLKKDYADWSKGDASTIRQGLKKLKDELSELHARRRKIKKEGPGEQLQTENEGKLRQKLEEYAKYASAHHVLLLSRVDKLVKAPETEFANGSGYVPEWSSHWTVDQQTDNYLEEIAMDAKMQLDLQEGLLLLRGHAGTGKDVLIKMFANRTNRPYFTTDCSKWTTEFELSEDVVLEAEDGASRTVKVPSVVLNAITTPGAVMYFNEINAMPEQAQIFLHGLMDEKRTLTLKTSSGKAVKTLDSVLLMGSMNPDYPGTFDPQFATKSRMVEIEIDYPPLYGQKDPKDPNQNVPISASEALRVARATDSLIDFTYEQSSEHNEFVKIWDRYVNGIQNGAPDLTPVQKFDLDAIVSMVEFAQKLREGFILKFEKRTASETRGKLLVGQPMTGREMRRMAYFLSKMSPEEKATANPEAVARKLIERVFLGHLNRKDREEIKTAMGTWTSFKRPAA